MKGILITGGALFVECGLMTYRYGKNEKWEVSPVLYNVLLWEMQTEPPERYTLLSDRELRTLKGELLKGLFDIHRRTADILGFDAETDLAPEGE